MMLTWLKAKLMAFLIPLSLASLALNGGLWLWKGWETDRADAAETEVANLHGQLDLRLTNAQVKAQVTEAVLKDRQQRDLLLRDQLTKLEGIKGDACFNNTSMPAAALRLWREGD